TEDGTMGQEQLAILTAEGVAASAIVIGHSCGSSNLDYHLAMLDRGAGVGFERQLVLSHDTVWCWRGRAPVIPAGLLPDWRPTHVFEHIIPRLREAGVPQAKVDAMLVENPRRYFTES